MKTIPLSLFALAAALISGCTDFGSNPAYPIPEGVALNASVDGKALTCPPDVRFALELDVHFDSGYIWTTVISDTSVIYLDTVTFHPKTLGPPAVGGLAVETLSFVAKAPGTSTVLLQEIRGWESVVRPLNTVRFTVTVQR